MKLPLAEIGAALRDEPPRTTWQIKVGTTCNLRCRYCYEWDRLGLRGRLTLPQWRRVFEAVNAHRALQLRESRAAVMTAIVWHGGEPTLHPPGYVRAVLALQREVLGGWVRNGVQTNLTAIGETLSIMADAGFLIGVSADFAPGARSDARGEESDARVRRNLERLLQSGAIIGVALVLGRHNSGRLHQVHDTLLDLGAAWLNVIPMFAPPAEAPGRDLLLPTEDVTESLERLFIYWMQHGARLPVYPLRRVLRAALNGMGAAGTTPDLTRRQHVRMVVQPDGTLQEQIGRAGVAVPLGNIFTDSLDDILKAALHRVAAPVGRPSPTEQELCKRVQRWLSAAGVAASAEALW